MGVLNLADDMGTPITIEDLKKIGFTRIGYDLGDTPYKWATRLVVPVNYEIGVPASHRVTKAVNIFVRYEVVFDENYEEYPLVMAIPSVILPSGGLAYDYKQSEVILKCDLDTLRLMMNEDYVRERFKVFQIA